MVKSLYKDGGLESFDSLVSPTHLPKYKKLATIPVEIGVLVGTDTCRQPGPVK